MASRSVEVALIARDNMSAAFSKAGSAAKTLGDSLTNLGKSNTGLRDFASQVKALDSEINTVGKAMTGFGVGITAAIGLSVRQFAGLEAAMANVGTIANQSDAWLADMTNQIKALAVELGTSPTGLAEGLYDLIGSGIDAADAFDVLRTSAVAAKAGLTDAGTAAQAITAVLNAYGLSADKAEAISDVLFKTVDSGVITFEELANSMGRALPLANTLAVSIDELGAAYAQLTRQGLNASEAETSFTALLTAALNPTEALTEAVREYGFESAEAMIRTEGFTFFLQFLDEVAGGSASKMQELTGNVRANNAALILARNDAEGYIQRLGEMETATGATSIAFERQMDTIAGSASRLRASLSVLSTEIGEAFAPFARAGLDIATEGIHLVIDAINGLPGPAQTAAAALTGLVGVTATLTGGFLLLLPRIVETAAAVRALGGLTSVITGVAAATSAWATALAVGFGGGVAIGGFMGTFVNALRDGQGVMGAFAESTNVLASAMQRLVSGDPVGFFRTLVFGVDEATRSLEQFRTTTSYLLEQAARQEVLGNDAIASSIENLVRYNDTVMQLAEQRVRDTQWMHQQIAIQVEATGRTWDQAEQDVRDAMTLTDAEIAVRAEALNVLAQAYLDPATNTAALNRELTELTFAFNEGKITNDQYTDGLVKLARQYGELPNDIQSATEASGNFWDTMLQLGGVDPGDIFGSVRSQLADVEGEFAKLDDRAADLRITLDDLKIAGDFEIAAELEKINELMLETTDSSEAYLDAQDRINDAIADGSVNFASVAAEITSLNEQLDAGTITQAEYEARIIAISESLANYTEGSRDAIERTRELTQEFVEAAFAIAGWDNALSQLNMTGMTGEMGLLAENTMRTGQAMDNTFRIIVGNTNALAGQISTINDWATELIGVQGEYGKIDDLLNDGLITIGQYNAAQQAQIEIAQNNAEVQQNILKIQAMQAPYIAETTAAFENQIELIARMPAEVQRTTLAFMDLQTVQTAQEIITLGNSKAFQAMGADGEAAFTQVIQGALQTNPLLFNILETMGIISGTPLNFEVNYDALEGAGSAIDQLVTQVGYLVDTLREIYNLPPIEVEGSVNITTSVNGAQTAAGVSPDSFAGQYASGWHSILGIPESAEVPVDVTIVPTITSVGETTGGTLANLRDQLDIPETVTTRVEVEGSDQVAQVKADIDALEDTTVTVDVDVDASSIADVMELLRTIGEAGAATMTVDVVIGTNELDTGLTQFGLGTGGGGGAAGFTAPSVSVDIVIGENELDTAFDTETPHEVTVNVDANVSQAQMKIDFLGTGDQGSAPAVTVNVDADTTEAVSAIENLTSAAGGVPPSVSIIAVALTEGAVNALDNVTAAANAIPESESVTVSAPGAEDSTGALNGVTDAANAIPESESVTVNVYGAAAAISALQGVADAAGSIPSSVSTTITTNRVTNNVQTFSTVGTPLRASQHGGIPSYATGGVLFRGGEAGPEIAHFATGGTALLPRDGLYMAPPMTYISPHNPSQGHGASITLDFSGAQFNNTSREEMNAWATQDLIPAIQQEWRRNQLATGVPS